MLWICDNANTWVQLLKELLKTAHRLQLCLILLVCLAFQLEDSLLIDENILPLSPADTLGADPLTISKKLSFYFDQKKTQTIKF